MPSIQLDRLVKRYGEVEVLHGIELAMDDNEFTVLVGPSGCGKSTTLRMIAGLEDVSDGEIFVDGMPVSHLEPKDRDLAMVFQDYALYPHMNVAQNISFALRLARRPKPEIDKTVKRVAAMVGLTDFLHRKPGALSGGQRQRVAMARALAKAAPLSWSATFFSSRSRVIRTLLTASPTVAARRNSVADTVTVLCLVAQRLARALAAYCKTYDEPLAELLAKPLAAAMGQ